MTRSRAAIALVAAALAAGALATPAALGDVAGPDDSVQQAFGPIQPGTWYAGAFVRSDDVDHLAIGVPLANTLVHVDVENTVNPCTSPDLTGCPIWATLVDAAGQQVGGEGSSAGTGRVDAGGSDVVDWTFTVPGTYFLAMDSAGDLPTYRVRHTTTTPAPAVRPARPVGTPSEPAGSGPSAGAAATLSLARRQRATAVRARIAVRRPLRRLTLAVVRNGTTITSTSFTAVRAGSRTVTLRLGPSARRALTRAGRLALTVRMVAVPVTGSRLVVRRAVTLVRPAPR